jgi:hypothetical protein
MERNYKKEDLMARFQVGKWDQSDQKLLGWASFIEILGKKSPGQLANRGLLGRGEGEGEGEKEER